MPREQFDEWWASAIHDGWAGGERQLWQLLIAIHRVLVKLAASQGADVKHEPIYQLHGDSGPRRTLTAAESEARAAALYGRQ